MTNDKSTNSTPRPIDEEAIKLIAETAYYKWLNRGPYVQEDKLKDWVEAENQLRDEGTWFNP